MSYAQQRYFNAPAVEVADGATQVVEVRGLSQLVAYFAAGTCTATACNADGVDIPGAAPLSLTSGTPIGVAAYYYRVAPVGGLATVLVLP